MLAVQMNFASHMSQCYGINSSLFSVFKTSKLAVQMNFASHMSQCYGINSSLFSVFKTSKLAVQMNFASHMSQCLWWYGHILFSWRISDENSSLVFIFINAKSQLSKGTSYHTSHNHMESCFLRTTVILNSNELSEILQEKRIPYHCKLYFNS